MIGSLLDDHADTLVSPAEGHSVPFTLSYLAHAAQRSVVQRFIDTATGAALPAGWLPPRAV